jgi:hypothetical protein
VIPVVCSINYLNGFFLFGGTALALHIGQRSSIDIDLFSNFDFDPASLVKNLHQDYAFRVFAPPIIKPKIGICEEQKSNNKSFRYLPREQNVNGNPS